MSDPLTDAKGLRARARNARRSMSAVDRTRASRIITDRFLNSRYFLGSDNVGCYVSTRDEVDTSAIIERAWRAKKRVFLPVTSSSGDMHFCETLPETGLAMNHFGLWEPVHCKTIEARRLDVVVTPLLAFDDQRNRLGMGGGYFDRAFAFLKDRNHWLHPKLIGIAFECQRVEKISPNPWDIPVFRIITETVQRECG
jgi:5-formyltetrahydrofolate cyclo-ligase